MKRTYIHLSEGRKPYRNTVIGDDCRDCGHPIVETTATALKTGRCKACYNIWFCDWVVRNAAKGTLTGTRAKLNGRDLGWKDPVKEPGAQKPRFIESLSVQQQIQRILCRPWRTDLVPPLYRSPTCEGDIYVQDPL